MRLHHLYLCAIVAIACMAALWRVAADAGTRAEYAVDCAAVRSGAVHVSPWEREACES